MGPTCKVHLYFFNELNPGFTFQNHGVQSPFAAVLKQYLTFYICFPIQGGMLCEYSILTLALYVLVFDLQLLVRLTPIKIYF